MQTLIKNTRAYTLLKAEGEKNRFGHAYLVQLDDSKNLRSALKSFAKLFFHCDDTAATINPQAKRVAELIDAENFSDCLFYPAEGEKFVVEDAQRLTEESTLKSVEGDKKVFVVCDFAEATVAAQNKLLKLLEEPPQGVIFLLGATTVYPVLSTVLSRVEKLEIPPFDIPQIEACLFRIYGQDGKYTRKDFQLCAAACGGCVGTAQSLLEGGDFHALLSDAFALCLAKPHELPVLVKKIGETKRKKEFLSLLRILFRDALVFAGGLGTEHLFLRAESEKLQNIASEYSRATLLYAQEQIAQAEKQLFFNTVFPQCVEILFAKIFRFKSERQTN